MQPVGISDVVTNLAAQAAECPSLAQDARELFIEIAQMRGYAMQGRLDDWETLLLPRTRDRARRVEDVAYRVGCALFELGRMNMYAEIEPESTYEAYGRVCEGLRSIGIVLAVECDVDLARWL